MVINLAIIEQILAKQICDITKEELVILNEFLHRKQASEKKEKPVINKTR